MPPNHVIVLILLLVPIFIFMLWRFGKHLLDILGHNLLMKMMDKEAQREEAQPTGEARVAAEINADAVILR